MKIFENYGVQALCAVLIYVVISYLYLYPGGALLLEGSKQYVMSDGTDPAAAPFSYGLLKQSLDHPQDLLYGAFPTHFENAPEGMAVWFFWYEKITATVFSQFLPLEQVTTAIVWFSYVLSALAFYVLGRILGWKFLVSLFSGLAWAISAYTRGRAKVHMALTATYFLPLIFIGVLLLKRDRSRKDIALAAGAFFLSALTAQYYILLTAFICPFIVWYYLADSMSKEMTKKRLVILGIAMLPAVGLLSWTLLKPVSSDFAYSMSVFPKTGETSAGEIHPFLTRFAAHPIDYLAGDVAIGVKDLNPLRYLLNRSVLENLEGSNSHERANGIRWVVLLFGLWNVFLLLSKRENINYKNPSIALFCLGFFGFLLSLSPNWFGFDIGPSVWLHKLVSQIRVTSRASLFVSFTLIMFAAQFVSLKNSKKWNWIFAILIFIELPPFLNAMPVVAVLPQHSSLSIRKDGECGLGLYYPYVSGQWQLTEFYYFLQRMRESRCAILNATALNDRETNMINFFPLHPDFIKLIIQNDPRVMEQLVRFTNCAQLSWIVFDQHVPEAWRQAACTKLGWKLTEADVCQAEQHNHVPVSFNSQCLGMSK